jgi:hypothetical protein
MPQAPKWRDRSQRRLQPAGRARTLPVELAHALLEVVDVGGFCQVSLSAPLFTALIIVSQVAEEVQNSFHS